MAIPDSGWNLGYWLRNGTNVGSSNPYDVTMDANCNLTAVFNVTYVLTIQVSGSGTTNPVVGSFNYTAGSNVTVSANPSSLWQFDHWVLNGSSVGSVNPYNVTMNANYNLTAVFSLPANYALVIQVSGQGTTSPVPGSYSYAAGSNVSVTSISNLGWNFSYWLFNGGNVGSVNPYNVTVSADCNLTAVFNVSPPQYVFADGFESGSFSSWNGASVSSGETATIVTALVHDGSYSASFTSNGGAGEEYAYSYKTINSSEVYVRGYFYLGGGLPLVSNGDRVYFLRLVGTQNLVYAGIRRNNGVDSWVLYVRNGASWMDWVSNSTAPLPQMGSWVSVELHWKNDAAQGLAELYVNGVRVISVTGINTASYGNAVRVDFGMPYSYSATARATNRLTIYADSAVIDNKYIGP
jgi:hypothetical protein